MTHYTRGAVVSDQEGQFAKRFVVETDNKKKPMVEIYVLGDLPRKVNFSTNTLAVGVVQSGIYFKRQVEVFRNDKRIDVEGVRLEPIMDGLRAHYTDGKIVLEGELSRPAGAVRGDLCVSFTNGYPNKIIRFFTYVR